MIERARPARSRGPRFVVLALVALAAGVPIDAARAQNARGQLERHASLPAASPNGRWIAFSSDRDSVWELYIVRSNGTGLRRLTRSEEEELDPGWAEGGRRVTYSLLNGDTLTLCSIGVGRGRDVRVHMRHVAKGTTLSNDGQHITYAVGSWTASHLMVADADGSNPLTLSDSTCGWFNMAWSPDDRRIAVTRRDPEGELQVWLIAANGSEARPLTTFSRAEGRPQWPAWSPDGRRIAVQAGLYDRNDPTKNVSDIWVIDVVSGKAKKITSRERPWLDETPTWVDSNRIAFQSSRTGRFEVWMMNADGTGLRQITR